MTIRIRSFPIAAALMLLSATFVASHAGAADSPQYFVHTAKDGDTLIGLASRYLVSRTTGRHCKPSTRPPIRRAFGPVHQFAFPCPT